MAEGIVGNRRLTAMVSGRVQGVGFRQFTVHEARRLGLVGWVRNCEDGDVELVAEGPEEKLQLLRRVLARGPANAAVDAVVAHYEPASGEFRGFNVTY